VAVGVEVGVWLGVRLATSGVVSAGCVTSCAVSVCHAIPINTKTIKTCAAVRNRVFLLQFIVFVGAFN
jgi:hypothetical protein